MFNIDELQILWMWVMRGLCHGLWTVSSSVVSQEVMLLNCLVFLILLRRYLHKTHIMVTIIYLVVGSFFAPVMQNLQLNATHAKCLTALFALPLERRTHVFGAVIVHLSVWNNLFI